jgi:hypothetical protein
VIIKTVEEPLVTEFINLQTEEPLPKKKQTIPQESKV